MDAARDQRVPVSAGPRAGAYLLLLVLALAVYLPGINRSLRDAEAKYAEIPREMLVLGDWLTPHLNFTRYYVKPPLTFWLTAGLYRVWGVHEWVARLTNIFWAFLAAFLTGLLARRMFGRGVGFLVSGMFLLTLGVFVYCLDAGLEFGLITFAVLAVMMFWEFYRSDSLPHLGLFYLFLGLGFMVKGLPGIVIPGTAAVLFLLFRRQTARLRRFFHPAAVIVLPATIAPWTVVMLRRHPDFLEVFLLNEHIRRFAGTMVSNDALMPTGVWLAFVAVEFLPWTIHLPQLCAALPKLIRRGAVPRSEVLFLLIWAAVPLFLYSLSRSKVDFYGLNSYPALTILLALVVRDVLGRRASSSSRTWAYPWLVIFIVAFLALLAVFVFPDQALVPIPEIASRRVALVFLAATCILGFGIALSFFTGRARLGFAGIALVMVVDFFCARAMFDAALPQRSMKFAAAPLSTLVREGDVVVSDEGPEFEHVATLNFYVGIPVFLLRNRETSILHFIQYDQRTLCLDEPDLVRLARAGRSIYLVGETQQTSDRLSRLGLTSEALAVSGDRTLFRTSHGSDDQ